MLVSSNVITMVNITEYNIDEDLMIELLDISNVDEQSNEALEFLDMFLHLEVQNNELNVVFSQLMINNQLADIIMPNLLRLVIKNNFIQGKFLFGDN